MTTKDKISFDEFLAVENKLDIRIGQIVAVERVPKSKKLLKMTVIFGGEEADERTVVTNIGDKFEDIDDLLATILPFIVNLEPVTMMGVTSEAMIMPGTSLEGGMVVDLFKFGLGTKVL